MRTTKLRRSVVALTTALACLMMMGTPASATVVTFRANFDSGTGAQGNLRLQNGTSILDVAIGGTPTGGTGCGNHVDVSLDIDSTGTTGTAQVLGLESTSRFLVGTTHYISVMSWVSTPTAGTITGSSTTGASVTGLGLRLKEEIYTTTNTSSTATDCARTTTLICRYNNVNLTFSGTWNNNIHDIQVSHGGSVSSNASTTLAPFPCNPPFSTYAGGTATFSNVPIHVCQIPAPTTPSGSCP